VGKPPTIASSSAQPKCPQKFLCPCSAATPTVPDCAPLPPTVCIRYRVHLSLMPQKPTDSAQNTQPQPVRTWFICSDQTRGRVAQGRHESPLSSRDHRLNIIALGYDRPSPPPRLYSRVHANPPPPPPVQYPPPPPCQVSHLFLLNTAKLQRFPPLPLGNLTLESGLVTCSVRVEFATRLASSLRPKPRWTLRATH